MEIDTSAPEPVKKVILSIGEIDGESLKISQKMNEKRATSRKRIKDAGMNTTAYGMGVKVAKMMFNQGERESFIKDFLVTVEVLTKVQAELFPELAAAADKKKAAQEKRAQAALAKAAKAADPKSQDKTAPDNPRGNPKRGGAGGAKGRGRAKDGSGAKAARGKGRGAPASDAVTAAEETSKLASDLAEANQSAHGAQPGDMAYSEQLRSDTAGDELIKSVGADLANEQAEGGDILDSHMQTIKGTAGLTGKTGLGSISDERPLSQSEQSRRILEETGLDKPA